tara:strand:+ start:308 stop:511 length:204 start_codon:yes stop_codon:yes gene_type:complete
MNKEKDYQYVSVSNITFHLSDDEGNILENKDGTIKEFYFKGRLKPLEYLCEDMTIEDLEEVSDEPSN